MARGLVRMLFGLAGFAAGLFALWVAFDDLTGPHRETWFALLVIAIVPVIVGMGYLLPQLIFARGPAQRTRVITDPLWTACQAVFMWLAAIAGGTSIGSWKGALVGGVVGAIMAAQGISSMRVLRRALDGPAESPPATAETPTRRQVVGILVKGFVFWIAGLIFCAGAGYVVAGRTGAYASVLLVAALIVFVYAQALYRLRRRHAHTE